MKIIERLVGEVFVLDLVGDELDAGLLEKTTYKLLSNGRCRIVVNLLGVKRLKAEKVDPLESLARTAEWAYGAGRIKFLVPDGTPRGWDTAASLSLNVNAVLDCFTNADKAVNSFGP